MLPDGTCIELLYHWPLNSSGMVVFRLNPSGPKRYLLGLTAVFGMVWLIWPWGRISAGFTSFGLWPDCTCEEELLVTLPEAEGCLRAAFLPPSPCPQCTDAKSGPSKSQQGLKKTVVAILRSTGRDRGSAGSCSQGFMNRQPSNGLVRNKEVLDMSRQHTCFCPLVELALQRRRLLAGDANGLWLSEGADGVPG